MAQVSVAAEAQGQRRVRPHQEGEEVQVLRPGFDTKGALLPLSINAHTQIIMTWRGTMGQHYGPGCRTYVKAKELRPGNRAFLLGNWRVVEAVTIGSSEVFIDTDAGHVVRWVGHEILMDGLASALASLSDLDENELADLLDAVGEAVSPEELEAARVEVAQEAVERGTQI